MGNINSYNPIISTRRKGTMDDPYINIEESFVVKDNKVLLSEIPSEKDHVNAIDVDNNELYYEIYDGIPDEREFIVDYRFGIITFHPYANDKNIKFTYVGTGNYYLPAKRVWTKQNNGVVEETLGDIIESGKEVIEKLPQVEIITNNAIAATENANNVAALITSAEEDRVIAEANRVDAENLRISNEEERQLQESIRQSQELEREDNENLRKTAEIDRKNAESTRVSNELIRESQEATRQDNELVRQSNEEDRQSRDTEFQVWEEYDSDKLYKPLNKVVFQGSSYICKVECQGVIPTDTDYWLKIASAGAGTLVEESDINGNIKINSTETIVYTHPNSHPASIIEITDDGEYFESTNVEDALQEIASELKSPELKSPEYSEPQETTSSVITLPNHVVEGQFSDVSLLGNSVQEIVENGNFSNGTAGWSGVAATVSANNNVLSVTGNGSSQIVRAQQSTKLDYVSGKKLYVRAKLKVTNASATKIGIDVYVTGMAAQSINLNSPTQGQSYVVSGIITLPSGGSGKIGIQLRHEYADANTANGKVMEVQEVMAIDMGTSANDNPLYNLTADEMNQRFPNWLPYGVVSTLSGRVKSVGKNLFDKNKVSIGLNKYLNSAGQLVTSAAWNVSDYIPVVGGNTYSFQGLSRSSSANICFYNNGVFISSATNDTFINTQGKGSINVPPGANSMRISFLDTNIELIQVEEGSTITEYEPFKDGGEAYINWEGRSLPNGTKDEFNVVTGGLTKKVSDNVSISGTAYASIDKTTYTNVDVVKTTSFSSAVAGTTAKDGMTRYYDKNGVELTEIAQADIDNAASVGKYYWHTDKTLWIIVAKGAYADITAARTGLGTTTLNYQLATPVVHEGKAQPLTAFPNGHIIIEPVVKEVNTYNNEITIKKAHLPIKVLESVYVINSDNSKTAIDISTCTIAPDGKSFTSTALTNSDNVEYTYFYDSSLSTLPTIKYSYPINLKAAVNSNTKAISNISESLYDLWLSQIGAETPAGAQAKANAALNSAKQYTDQEVGGVSQALAAHQEDNASTSKKGHVQLTDSVSSTSTTTAATPNSVKQAYDKANAALPKSGGTMTGILTAQSNTSYTVRQVRNIILSTADADVNAMQNGDIWIKYK